MRTALIEPARHCSAVRFAASSRDRQGVRSTTASAFGARRTAAALGLGAAAAVAFAFVRRAQAAGDRSASSDSGGAGPLNRAAMAGEARSLVRSGMSKFLLAGSPNDAGPGTPLELVEASIADFDRALELDPTCRPRLWQRGLR